MTRIVIHLTDDGWRSKEYKTLHRQLDDVNKTEEADANKKTVLSRATDPHSQDGSPCNDALVPKPWIATANHVFQVSAWRPPSSRQTDNETVFRLDTSASTGWRQQREGRSKKVLIPHIA